MFFFFLGKVERQRCFAALRGVFRWNSRYSALITACGTAKHWQRAVALLSEAQLKPRLKVLLNRYGYGSIPINTIFSGLFTSINPSYFEGYYWF